jgi:hypothetical protein
MHRSGLLVAIIGALVLAGCSDPAPPDGEVVGEVALWDAEVRDGFLDACLATAGGAGGYCRCALSGLEQEYTQAEFEAIEGQMLRDSTVPPRFQAIVEDCFETHVGELFTALGQDGAWSEAARTQYLAACVETSGGLTAYCTCAIDGLEARYSQTEFTTISMAIQRGGEVPDAYEAIVQECFAEHGE